MKGKVYADQIFYNLCMLYFLQQMNHFWQCFHCPDRIFWYHRTSTNNCPLSLHKTWSHESFLLSDGKLFPGLGVCDCQRSKYCIIDWVSWMQGQLGESIRWSHWTIRKPVKVPLQPFHLKQNCGWQYRRSCPQGSVLRTRGSVEAFHKKETTLCNISQTTSYRGTLVIYY